MTDSLTVESFSQFVELKVGETPKNKKKNSNMVTYWTMLNDAARVDGKTGAAVEKD